MAEGLDVKGFVTTSVLGSFCCLSACAGDAADAASRSAIEIVQHTNCQDPCGSTSMW